MSRATIPVNRAAVVGADVPIISHPEAVARLIEQAANPR
jgi:hypothetical protein